MIYKDYFTPSTVIEENHLEHHGVLGMKWGVRRFQNADGSLTSAGKQRAQEEANILSKAMEKHLDTTNDFQRSLKKTYLVDKDGNNRWTSSGKGYFDNRGGVITYDRNKLAAKERNEQSYLKIKDIMNKSYNSVKVDATYDIETGKSSSKIFLEKNGEIFVSEFTKDYGAFDTSKQTEFKLMFDN